MAYFLDLLVVNYVNLILWQKLYVAFNNLDNRKIQWHMGMKTKL